MAIKLTFSFFLGLIILTFSSCKKENPEPNEIDTSVIDKSKTYLTNKQENELKNSVWYYYKALSIWEEIIPHSISQVANKNEDLNFIQNNYTQYFEKAESVLDYLKTLTKKHPNRKQEKDYDWYSILDRGNSVINNVQGTMTSGLGLTVFYLQNNSNDNNKRLFIRSIDKGSSAHSANLQRGDQILSINGDTKIDYNNQFSKNNSTILDYLSLSSIRIKVKKQNGDILETDLNHKYYSSNPILTSKIINSNERKIGYFVLNSFASIRRGFSYSSFYYELQSLFNEFEINGINELVIDLRNNGGGDVETAEYLANRIAPANLTGSEMYTYEVNQFIKKWEWFNEEEFAPIKFNKIGSLKLSRVYFLVSSETASASELLINSLIPVMPTYMIGTFSLNDKKQEVAEKTYGKPVGFIDYPVLSNNVKLYIGSFKMYNSKGKGDYFDGLTPNSHVWEFKDFYDFGDVKESMLAAALHHIQTGTFNTYSFKANVRDASSNQAYKEIKTVDTVENPSKNNMFKFKKNELKNN